MMKLTPSLLQGMKATCEAREGAASSLTLQIPTTRSRAGETWSTSRARPTSVNTTPPSVFTGLVAGSATQPPSAWTAVTWCAAGEGSSPRRTSLGRGAAARSIGVATSAARCAPGPSPDTRATDRPRVISTSHPVTQNTLASRSVFTSDVEDVMPTRNFAYWAESGNGTVLWRVTDTEGLCQNSDVYLTRKSYCHSLRVPDQIEMTGIKAGRQLGRHG